MSLVSRNVFGSSWNLLVSSAANAGPVKNTTAQSQRMALATPLPQASAPRRAAPPSAVTILARKVEKNSNRNRIPARNTRRAICCLV